MERRHTIQRETVLEAVRELKNHPTVDEIYTYVHNAHPSISRGTVYRDLTVLAEEKEIQRVDVPGGAVHYDHTVEKHHHVSCVRCGRVSDVLLVKEPEIASYIKGNPEMTIVDYDLVFKGICKECQA